MIAILSRLSAALLLAMPIFLAAGSAAYSENGGWLVSKSSGEVAITVADAQPAVLSDGTMVNPGANIRTGQNGRVLLVRGDETMLIAPNSDIEIPKAAAPGRSTTIFQRAGSVLLDVEKRDVKHFQVETPYLAAVVKGTQFKVTVDSSDARVDVLSGAVEVSEFKSGQYALVRPGQAATVSALLATGLSLSGSGTLSPIQQGAPRKSMVEPPPAGWGARASTDAAPAGSQFRVSQSSGGHAAASGAEGGWNNKWVSGLFGTDKGGSDGATKRNNGDDLSYTLALAVGAVVTLTAAVQRRRQKGKKDSK